VLIAFMGWHIMFSRTAFMVTAQPLIEVVFLGLLFSAYKRDSYALYAAPARPWASACTPTTPTRCLLAPQRSSPCRCWWLNAVDGRPGAPLGLMFAVAFVVALPLISYIRDEKNDYMAHHRLISVLYKPEFEDEDLPGKARVLIERSVDWAKLVTLEPKADYTDATGTTPLLDRITLGLLLLGFGVCLRRRTPAHLALLVFLLVMPVAAIVTIDGSARRSLGMAPIVAMLAALPLARVWEWAELNSGDKRTIAQATVACVLLVVAIVNVRTYFEHTGDSVDAKWVYVEQLAEASKYIETLPDKPYVYFYSSRWGYDYETRRYLAPDLKGENRSTEFGKRVNADGEEEPPPLTDFDARVPSVVLLLPAYFDVLDAVESEYPGGHKYVGRNHQGEVLFHRLHAADGPALTR
jgi:hypothetical protein